MKEAMYQKGMSAINASVSLDDAFISIGDTLVPHLVPPEDKGYREPSDRISIEFPFDILDNITPN